MAHKKPVLRDRLQVTSWWMALKPEAGVLPGKCRVCPKVWIFWGVGVEGVKILFYSFCGGGGVCMHELGRGRRKRRGRI